VLGWCGYGNPDYYRADFYNGHHHRLDFRKEGVMEVKAARRWIIIGGGLALLLACWLLWAGYDALPTADRFLIAGRVVGISICIANPLIAFLIGLYVGRTRESRQQEIKL